MATFLDSPISHDNARPFSFQAGTSAREFSHFPGSTYLDIPRGRDSHDLTTSNLPDRPYYQPTRLKQSPVATPTNSELREVNNTLIEMLRTIQNELAMQREVMMDIQKRVSNLEHQTMSSILARIKRGKKEPPPQDHPSQRASILNRESRTWWEACQNFAHNCDTPFPATEFLVTPRRFSGFDFNFNIPKTTTTPPTPPPRTPEVDDVPSLTPGSEHDDQSKVSTPNRHEHSLPVGPCPTPIPATKQHDDTGSDIVERILHYDKIRVPRPPKLCSPPRSLRSKTSLLASPEEDMTALPQMALRPSTATSVPKEGGRQHKRIMSLFTYKALMTGKGLGERERDREEGSKRLYIHR